MFKDLVLLVLGYIEQRALIVMYNLVKKDSVGYIHVLKLSFHAHKLDEVLF